MFKGIVEKRVAMAPRRAWTSLMLAVTSKEDTWVLLKLFPELEKQVLSFWTPTWRQLNTLPSSNRSAQGKRTSLQRQI